MCAGPPAAAARGQRGRAQLPQAPEASTPPPKHCSAGGVLRPVKEGWLALEPPHPRSTLHPPHAWALGAARRPTGPAPEGSMPRPRFPWWRGDPLCQACGAQVTGGWKGPTLSLVAGGGGGGPGRAITGLHWGGGGRPGHLRAVSPRGGSRSPSPLAGRKHEGSGGRGASPPLALQPQGRRWRNLRGRRAAWNCHPERGPATDLVAMAAGQLPGPTQAPGGGGWGVEKSSSIKPRLLGSALTLSRGGQGRCHRPRLVSSTNS